MEKVSREKNEEWVGTKHIYEPSSSILFHDTAEEGETVLRSILSHLSHLSPIGFPALGTESQNARVISAQRCCNCDRIPGTTTIDDLCNYYEIIAITDNLKIAVIYISMDN